MGMRMTWCMPRSSLGEYPPNSKVTVWGKRRFSGRLGYGGRRSYLGVGGLGFLGPVLPLVRVLAFLIVVELAYFQ